MSGLTDPWDWVKLGCIIWGCYTLGEQQTVALLVVVKHSFTAAVASITLCSLGLVLSSGVLRYRPIISKIKQNFYEEGRSSLNTFSFFLLDQFVDCQSGCSILHMLVKLDTQQHISIGKCSATHISVV